ncbi:MAG: hypothetical protein ACREJ6_05985 [Candidatus Methylomirabilis sp.]
MTTRWPCVVIALFCCLLGITLSASAEGAWVLWVEGRRVGEGAPPSRYTEWDIKQAFDQRAKGVNGLDVIENEWGEKITPSSRHRPVRFNDTQFTLIPLPVGYWHTEYRCLPDTIDPREKGDCR